MATVQSAVLCIRELALMPNTELLQNLLLDRYLGFNFKD